MPLFQAHQTPPPFSSPLVRGALFFTRPVSCLVLLLLPLPPLQFVSPYLFRAPFPSPPSRSSLFLPSGWWVLIRDVLCFQAHQCALPSSSPSGSESSFVMCHIFKPTNRLLINLYPFNLCNLAFQCDAKWTISVCRK